MPYIGKQPEHGRFAKVDQINSGFNGSAVTFNLTVDSVAVYPTNPQNLLVSIGGVIQQPGTDYTVSAATLTLTSAPASSTDFFGVLLGDVLDIGTPSDGSVTVSKMAANSVDSDQYLDGSIDTVHLGNLQVTGAKIAANTVTGDKIALGSDVQGDVMYYSGADWVKLGADNGKFLRSNGTSSNPSWETVSAGAAVGSANTWTADQTYTDNTKITLGCGGDVDLYFNGANLVLNPQVAGNGHIQICEADIGTTAANAGTLNLNSTDAGTCGPIIVIRHFSGSPTDGDNPFTMAFRMQDDAGSPNDVLGAQMQIRLTDASNCSMNTEMRFGITCGNSSGNGITHTGTLTGNGVWTDSSAGADKLYEGDATSVWGARVIDLLPNLNVGQYRNVSRPICNPGARHVSPTAEDLWDMFHLGHDPYSLITTPGIAAKDLGGLALMAAQELIGEVVQIKRHLGI